MTDPGQLRERLKIEQALLSTRDDGGLTVTWSTLAKVWARVQPLRGREALAAQQLESSLTHRVTIRYRSDIRAAMRLDWNGLKLNIRTVGNPDERRHFTELMCEQGVAT